MTVWVRACTVEAVLGDEDGVTILTAGGNAMRLAQTVGVVVELVRDADGWVEIPELDAAPRWQLTPSG